MSFSALWATTSADIIGWSESRLKSALRVRTLNGVKIKGYDLSRGRFYQADFRNAHLQDTSFWAANLRRADFRGADFVDSSLASADLRGAKFDGANLAGTSLRYSNLADVDLTGSLNLDVVNLVGSVRNEGTRLPAHIAEPALLELERAEAGERRRKSNQSRATAITAGLGG